MKANELMIDDWASFLIEETYDDGEVRQPMRINSIAPWEAGGDVESEEGVINDPEQLLPIPLTAEILEKNGFEKTLDEDDIECYRYYNRAADGYIKITLYDGGDGDWSVEIVNYDKFNDNEIRYKNEFSFLKVHQLQHALRLCETEKEIEL